MARITGMYGTKSDPIYMETVYPVLSMFCLLFLHLFLYGCNIFMWRKTRVNCSFILELSTTKELKYRDVFLIFTTSMAAVIGIMFVHLSLVTKGLCSSPSHSGIFTAGNRIKQDEDGFTMVNLSNLRPHNEPFILSSQAKQAFYVVDSTEKGWHVAISSKARDDYDMDPIETLDTHLQSEVGNIQVDHANEDPSCLREGASGFIVET